jgi:hypothetical protein
MVHKRLWEKLYFTLILAINTTILIASLLASYHLTSTVDFPTRVSNTLATAIDNIFINRNINKTFSIIPLPNGLSDHDAQLLTLSRAHFLNFSSSSVTRQLINDHTITEFKNNLSTEYWADIFNIDDDINTMFNNFLNTYLRIFNNSFPCKKFILSHTNQPWLTTGIKVSCFRKRELYLLSRNLELTRYYKNYCKILKEVIKLAK